MNKIIQALMDIIIGAAVYFGFRAFMPDLNNDVLVMITLTVTGLFAESVELRWKKGESKETEDEEE